MAILFYFILFSVYGCFAYKYVRALHLCSVCGVQKRILDPLELELWTVVGPQMLGLKPGSMARTSGLNCQTIFQGLTFLNGAYCLSNSRRLQTYSCRTWKVLWHTYEVSPESWRSRPGP